ncbi:transposase, MuDR, MULE transposase domain protein [Tanacetum coccineum]
MESKECCVGIYFGCPVASFAQLPYYCHNLELTNDGTVTHIETDDEDRFKMVFISFGVMIRSFKYHMRPLIIIDATHLKGKYEGTNLLAVGMDGNNQIIPIATGVSQGETSPSWTWFLLKLKECIGEILNLTIISDRHTAILSSCEVCLFWKMCKAYTVEDFGMAINELRSKRPDVYEKLIEAGVVCNIPYFQLKVPITNLTEWYRKLVQRWYCERREKYKDGPLDELSTYQELVYHVGEVSSWQIPNYLPNVKPPHMDKQPSGRPKSTKRIRSQGEEPVTVRCGRCGARRHNRQGCRETISYTKRKLQQVDDYLPQSMSLPGRL